MAYNLLHEFWHVTANILNHPIQGDVYIEGTPSATLPKPAEGKIDKNGEDVLILTETSEKIILENYKKTWCEYIIDERKGV